MIRAQKKKTRHILISANKISHNISVRYLLYFAIRIIRAARVRAQVVPAILSPARILRTRSVRVIIAKEI